MPQGLSLLLIFTFAAGDYHGHMEHTAGQLTKGEYKVKLPDGRVQVVSYEADHAGFRPRVTYEGVAAVAPGNDNLSRNVTDIYFQSPHQS